MKHLFFGLVGLALVTGIIGCATAPKDAAGKQELQSEVDAAIAHAKASDPSLEPFFKNAAGFVVFPSVGKGGIGLGAAYGKGILYEKGLPAGYMKLEQASIGLQLGGQVYTEIIFLETPQAVADMKSGNFAFSAQATAVALKSGAGANAKYSNAVAVFTMGESGLMYEASIGGQKFTYEPMR